MPNEPMTYSFDDLAVWKTELPEVEHAVLPSHNDRPNPLVGDNIVYASVFSRGAVCALERKSGKLLWRKEILKLAGSAVHLADGKLFAKTAQTLFGLRPDTGETIWTFSPYGDSGETIYSDPTIHRNSVFIGDRRGYLHCLDVKTGRTRWQRLTSTAKKNRDVNSTPIVHGGRVFIATNAKIAKAYDVKTGREAWKCRINAPSVIGPLMFRRMLVVVTDSIYFLKPGNGKLIRKFSWRGEKVGGAECSRHSVVCTLDGPWLPSAKKRLVGVGERGVRFSQAISAFVEVAHCPQKAPRIYISHLEGIQVRDDSSGKLLFTIKLDRPSSGVGPVDVKEGLIYALTGDGRVYALKDPAADDRR